MLKTIARWSVSLALLAFVVARLAREWSSVEAMDIQIRWGWVAGATALVGLEFLVMVEIWRKSLQWLQAPLSYPLAFHIMGASNLAKYLPGGVWNFIGRAALCQRYDVPTAKVMESLMVEVVVQIGANAAIAVIAFFTIGVSTAGLPAWTVLCAGAPLFALHPAILNFALSRLARVLRRDDVPRVGLRYAQILLIYAASIAAWALLGLAFAVFAQGILARSLSTTEAIAIVGAVNAAWLAGSIAFFVPAALGVREVAFTAILGPMFALGWPAAFAVATRLWFTLIEVAWFAVAQVTDRHRSSRTSAAP